LDAAAYVAENSLTGAQQLLEIALDTAESLSVFDERGRVVPELQQPNIRELLVQRYRLIYEVFDTKVEIMAFIHGARDFAKWRQSLSDEAG
jgi:plasmid stabilization system protein ParE